MSNEISKAIKSVKLVSNPDNVEVSVEVSKTEMCGTCTYKQEMEYSQAVTTVRNSRPDVLPGYTTFIEPPSHILSHKLYITVNYVKVPKGDGTFDRLPYEVFFGTIAAQHHQWLLALALLISSGMREGGNIDRTFHDLKVTQDYQGYWDKGVFYQSLVSHIGTQLEKMVGKIRDKSLKNICDENFETMVTADEPLTVTLNESMGSVKEEHPVGEQCPNCGQHTYVKSSGCGTCTTCGYSSCG